LAGSSSAGIPGSAPGAGRTEVDGDVVGDPDGVEDRAAPDGEDEFGLLPGEAPEEPLVQPDSPRTPAATAAARRAALAGKIPGMARTVSAPACGR
jgi:hypothetical protein